LHSRDPAPVPTTASRPLPSSLAMRPSEIHSPTSEAQALALSGRGLLTPRLAVQTRPTPSPRRACPRASIDANHREPSAIPEDPVKCSIEANPDGRKLMSVRVFRPSLGSAKEADEPNFRVPAVTAERRYGARRLEAVAARRGHCRAWCGVGLARSRRRVAGFKAPLWAHPRPTAGVSAMAAADGSRRGGRTSRQNSSSLMRLPSARWARER
jgi:hypothetical protein